MSQSETFLYCPDSSGDTYEACTFCDARKDEHVVKGKLPHCSVCSRDVDEHERSSEQRHRRARDL